MAVYKTNSGWRAEISFKDLQGKYRKKENVALKIKKQQKHGYLNGLSKITTNLYSKVH